MTTHLNVPDGFCLVEVVHRYGMHPANLKFIGGIYLARKYNDMFYRVWLDKNSAYPSLVGSFYLKEIPL